MYNKKTSYEEALQEIKEELINQGYFRKYGNFDKSHTKNKKSSPLSIKGNS